MAEIYFSGLKRERAALRVTAKWKLPEVGATPVSSRIRIHVISYMGPED